MNKGLKKIFDKSIEIFQDDPRIISAWHSGSVAEKNDDEFSDVDPVLLIKEEYFEVIDNQLIDIFQEICPNVLLRWPESFNDNTIKNYAFLLEMGTIYQYDITIIKESCLDVGIANFFICHCKKEDIIFDKNNNICDFIKKYSSKEEAIEIANSHSYILNLIEKFWLYVFISMKYFQRKDIYKIIYARDEMFKAHLDILSLFIVDGDWSWWPAGVNKNLKEDKRREMLAYFGASEISYMLENLKKQLEMFSNDAKLLCNERNVEYPNILEHTILKYVGKTIGKRRSI